MNWNYLDPGYLFDNIAPAIERSLNIGFSSASEVRSFLHAVFFFLCFFFVTIICYCFVRLLEIRKKEHAHVHHELAEFAHKQKEKEKKRKEGEGISTNPRWMQVLEYISSANPNDWKLAVIEADSMLDTLMDNLGFKGETLGEKLKSADRDKFQSLSAAWEAHIVRNRIAHEGSSFELPVREANRVVALYEQIFREFGFI